MIAVNPPVHSECEDCESRDSGIASHYPGDKNIASDPAVIFVDDFESDASPSDIQNKLDNVYHFEPSLRTLGINNALADPVVTLYDSNANVIAANDDWKDSQQSTVENTGPQPPNDLDAALLVRLAPGNYTAIVTGKSGSVGVGLAEVYAVP